jgi:hypothetical protein
MIRRILHGVAETAYIASMPTAECPQCHLPTASTLGKTYCPQCGWNREEAEKQTRLLLRLLPVLVMVFDAPLIVWIFIGHAEVPILAALGALAFIPAILVVLVVRGKVRLGGAAKSSGQRANTGMSQSDAKSIAALTDSADKQFSRLAELQRPRRVRMSRLGKMNAAVIAISLLMFMAALIVIVVIQPAAGRARAYPRAAVFLLPVGLAVGIVWVMRRSLVQQKWLLEMGSLAMGRVTKQWIARSGYGIRYEFTTASGETISRATTDTSSQLLEGMSVPVFYDPQAPKKQVALCASFYEIVLPGKE